MREGVGGQLMVVGQQALRSTAVSAASSRDEPGEGHIAPAGAVWQGRGCSLEVGGCWVLGAPNTETRTSPLRTRRGS